MIEDLTGLAGHLEEAIREFCDIAVIGISGGVDSATVASICCAALGKDQVFLLSMPYGQTDCETFNSRSAELAVHLGANHHVVNISAGTNGLMNEIAESLGESDFDPLVQGNTRSRQRMAVLYAFCFHLGKKFQNRARVIGTGNASEDLIGYDTKGGDALCDLFPIGELFKSEVYQLAEHYNVPESITSAEPSAGLYDGQTDEQELGYSYDELEPAQTVLFNLIEDGLTDVQIVPTLGVFDGLEPTIVEFVINMFKRNAHKHRAPQVVKVRRVGEFVD